MQDVQLYTEYICQGRLTFPYVYNMYSTRMYLLKTYGDIVIYRRARRKL